MGMVLWDVMVDNRTGEQEGSYQEGPHTGWSWEVDSEAHTAPREVLHTYAWGAAGVSPYAAIHHTGSSYDEAARRDDGTGRASS